MSHMASDSSLSLFTKENSLAIEHQRLAGLLAKTEEKLAHSNSQIDRLLEIIGDLKRMLFGPKAERWESPLQYCLFNEAEVEGLNSSPETSEDPIQVEGFERTRGKRKPLPEHLPREIVVLDLPAEEQVSAEGTPLYVVGKEISEKLFYKPAEIKVIQYHRLRYGTDGGDSGKIAPPVPSIVAKGIATPSLLAQIVTSKYVDGLPLYRQEKIFARLNIDLSRSSMGRWVIQCADACQPIWNLLEERLMANPYVSCDETYTQVLKEKDKLATTPSWMWGQVNPK